MVVINQALNLDKLGSSPSSSLYFSVGLGQLLNLAGASFSPSTKLDQ